MHEEVRYRWRYTNPRNGRQEIMPGFFTAQWMTARFPDAEPIEDSRQVVRMATTVEELGKGRFGLVSEDEEK